MKNKINKLSFKYLGDYKVSFEDKQTDLKADILLDKENYIGVSHADTIAQLKTTYKLIDGKYQPVSIALYNIRDMFITRVKITTAN